MNQYRIADGINLHSLQIFRAVVEAGGFTAAGQNCGLTQSAVTRQIQTLEDILGTRLFERTTRRVRMTEAGQALYQETGRILSDFHHTLSSFQRVHGTRSLQVRTGIARSVAFAYLPGFFTAFRREYPNVEIHFTYSDGDFILEQIKNAELDIGICCDRIRLPSGLEKTHEFVDRFTAILPPGIDYIDPKARFREGPFIGLSQESETGRRLANWLKSNALDPTPTVQTDSFDLMINLVSLGFGVAVVPIRALAIYGRRKAVTRISLGSTFERKLIAVARRDRKRPDHLDRFISKILF